MPFQENTRRIQGDVLAFLFKISSNLTRLSIYHIYFQAIYMQIVKYIYQEYSATTGKLFEKIFTG
jgi:hypothetical protein